MEYANKIIGMVMVIIATSGYGFVLSRDIKLRLKELKELKKIIFLLKGEIGFGHTPILEAFDNISRRCVEPFKVMLTSFVEYGKKSDKKPFSEIWNEGMKGLVDKTHLSKDEKEMFMKLGSDLGLSDIKTQQNAMDTWLVAVIRNRVCIFRTTWVILAAVNNGVITLLARCCICTGVIRYA